MAAVIPFQLSKDDYLELAGKAFVKEDFTQCVVYLNKAIEMDGRCFAAYSRLAAAYAKMGSVHMSNLTIYKALSLHPDEDTENMFWYTLGFNFLEMGDRDAASYYLRDFGDEVQISDAPSETSVRDAGGAEFRVVYPRGEDYYAGLMERAYGLMRMQKPNEAAQTASEIPPSSEYYDQACHLQLVCYMMIGDADRVIDSAKEMLRKKDSLAVRCTLISAYVLEERMDEAKAEIDKIIAAGVSTSAEVSMVLPMLISFDEHGEVVRCVETLPVTDRLKPNVLIWYSQALYNLGRVTDAKRAMHSAFTLYRDYTAAEYYLRQYNSGAEQIEYSLVLPYTEKIGRYKLLGDYYLKMTPEEFSDEISHDEDARKLIRWAFLDGEETMCSALTAQIALSDTEWGRDFIKDALISVDLSFSVMSRLVQAVLDGGRKADFCVVAQDRFKFISLNLPLAFYKLPSVLKKGVFHAAMDIIYADEEPQFFLDILTECVDKLVTLAPNGALRYKVNGIEENIRRMRSLKAVICALLARVYIDDESTELATERYEVSYRTFAKYYNYLFGEEYVGKRD